jgi:hypothetical protein
MSRFLDLVQGKKSSPKPSAPAQKEKVVIEEPKTNTEFSGLKFSGFTFGKRSEKE